MNLVASGNVGSFGGNGAGPSQYPGGVGMSRLGPGVGSTNTDGSGGSITGGSRKKARLN